MLQVTEEQAKRHYAEHEGKGFFKGLVDYITATPIVAMVIEGEDAIEGCRSTIGATNPIKATPARSAATTVKRSAATSCTARTPPTPRRAK